MITLPPVKLPLFSRDARSGPASGIDVGAAQQWLFEYTAPTRLYVVTWSFDEAYATPGQLRVFKSLDGGSTWSASLDDANGPLLPKQVESVFQAGNILACAFFNTAGEIQIVEFDVSTDTFSVVSAVGPSTDNVQVPFTLKLVQFASGRYRVFYNYGDIAEAVGYKYADLVGGVVAGVWSPEVILEPTVIWKRNCFANLVYDPNTDLIQYFSVFISIIPADSTWQIFRHSITEGGVVSSLDAMGGFTIGPVNGITDPPQAPFVGKCAAWNDFLVAPTTFYITPQSSGSRQAVVLMGTPIAAPVWTPVFINTVPTPPTNQTDYEAYAFDDGTRLFIFWVYTNRLAGGPPPINQIYWTSTLDGVTWTDPVLFYDAIANPPAQGASVQYNHAVSVIKLLSGAFGTVLALQANISAPTTSDCVGYFLLDAPGALALSCNNPPDGVIGVAYDHFLIASGGVPPYVDYSVIAGALPDGLSLNNLTGEITGTPTLTGTFGFTVEVTDDNGDTAQVDCEITITGMTLACGNPPNGKVGQPYNHQLAVVGGIPPLHFTLTAGALPDGLSLLEPSGIITGTPTRRGRFTFTVHLADSSEPANEADVECSISICPMNAQGA